MAKKTAPRRSLVGPTKTRSYLSQADVPSLSLDQAMRVPTAIAENYGGTTVSPLQLANALMIQPTSGSFRQLCGASIAYGLTQGGYNADSISVEQLGRRIVRPLEEGDELVAKREAILRPRVLREFLTKYDGSPLPRKDIAQNVLVDLGVPSDRVADVYDLICESAESVGFLLTIKDRQYVNLNGATTSATDSTLSELSQEPIQVAALSNVGSTNDDEPVRSQPRIVPGSEPIRRVYVTHGKNRGFIEPIKKLLTFGEMEAVVSVEKQSVSKPLPDKVMDDMRTCGAAIIHVDDEQRLIDRDAQEHIIINPNVLIEIGAAMALFGRRFILLVRDGVRLPSNLSGLYEVRYTNDALDGDTTIKLLEAINDMKKKVAPSASS